MDNLGWVVLSGKTHINNPHVNFRHAFAESSNSSNDVRISWLSFL
jgi:L-type amino acid transporter 9